MIRRATRTAAPLSTRTFTTDIIGGEEVCCAERFGFTQTKEGIKSALAVVAEKPQVLLADVQLAQYMENLGTVVFVDADGVYYYWDKAKYSAAPKQGTLDKGRAFVIPCFQNSYDSHAIFGGTKMVVAEKSMSMTSKLTTPFYCGVYHNGRVFARSMKNPCEIHWSGNRPSDWTQAISRSGYVRLDPYGGDVLNILEYGGKIVLVRKYGICEISAQGDPRNFRVESRYEKILPEVVPDTAVICCGKLWVYTALGLYGYDGNTVSGQKLDFLGKNYNITRAMAYRGRYIYFDSECDGYKQILEYDVEENTLTPLARGFCMPFETAEGLCVFGGSAIYRLTERTDGVVSADEDSRIWTSETFTCGTDAAKTLKSLSAAGEGSFRYIVNCDGRVREASGFGTIPVNERGKRFTFTVKGYGTLKSLTAQWEVNRGI